MTERGLSSTTFWIKVVLDLINFLISLFLNFYFYGLSCPVTRADITPDWVIALSAALAGTTSAKV